MMVIKELAADLRALASINQLAALRPLFSDAADALEAREAVVVAARKSYREAGLVLERERVNVHDAEAALNNIEVWLDDALAALDAPPEGGEHDA